MEYKDMVLGTLIQTAIDERDNVYFKMSQEVEEVYRKAQAFDKLVEFYPQKDEIPSDEFFMMMGYIIKERADDER
ncbi:hypothetical protein BMJ13_08010 [Staphylococcus saprophyticus]|uniref:hypothetical protein n=1 Tax=Staphylococcus saprophyticus TaxID=29385 RepID=UPI00094B7DD9|nr:hypothetical protein [Staphylococcus saprophyticus]OLN92930.1 hypothetical protein BMJ13_08010 [Staphylococcus saprophyticus]